ncbi:class I SAM-dependent methyltransferase [Thermoleophilia bacterium SCSIO 60948]|nr:class I SAM-dependent methyltransferase [Thermoleophilia bacterium SCSIO 60948]
MTELPSLDEIAFGEVLAMSLSTPTTHGTHGLHRFPAKFVPQIPRWALREFSHPGALVVDPFVGSGTTLVEALRYPVRAIGIDLDPLACAIARAKADVPNLEDVRLAWSRVIARWPHVPVPANVPMSGVDNPGHWFSEGARSELDGLFRAIEAVEMNARTRAFLHVAVSSVLRRVSNADDQSMKTYVSHTNPKDPPAVRAIVGKSVDRAIAGLASLENMRNSRAEMPRVLHADARELPIESSSVDLMITSPPYLDSVDYQYNLMAEYFWLGPLVGAESRDDFNLLRRQATGAKNPLSETLHVPKSVAGLLSAEHVPHDRWRSTVSYLQDLDTHLAEAARCLKRHGIYVMVVGNSGSRNGEVPLHDCLTRMAASRGLSLEHAFGYRVRRHYMKFPRKGRGGIILVDWVLVFRRVMDATPSPDRLPLLGWTLPPDAVAN